MDTQPRRRPRFEHTQDSPTTSASLPPECNPFDESAPKSRHGRARSTVGSPNPHDRRALALVKTVNGTWSDNSTTNGDAPDHEEGPKPGRFDDSTSSQDRSHHKDCIEVEIQNQNVEKGGTNVKLGMVHIQGPGSEGTMQGRVTMLGCTAADGFSFDAGSRFMSESAWRVSQRGGDSDAESREAHHGAGHR